MRPGQAGRVPGAEWLVEVRGRATPRWQGTQGHNGRVRTHSVGSKGVRMAKQGKVTYTVTAEQVELLRGILAGAGLAVPKAAGKAKRKAGKASNLPLYVASPKFRCECREKRFTQNGAKYHGDRTGHKLTQIV